MVVLRRPTFLDVQRFRCVCCSWNTIAASVDGHPQIECHRGALLWPPLPYLLFIGFGGADDPSRRLYSIPDGKIHRFNFPEESRDWWCYDVSGSWFAIVHLVACIFLFNPISGTRIDLPDLSMMPHVKVVVCIRGGAKYHGEEHLAGVLSVIPEMMLMEEVLVQNLMTAVHLFCVQ